ncbi:MAG: SGNH/GDSL hydrolase family protein [Ferruginibacter sp.]
MKILLIPFMMLSIVSSCSKKEQQSYFAPVVITQPVAIDSISYLALGDSYTIGQSVEEIDRYPIQTRAILKGDSTNISFPEIIARTGWTTGDLITRLNTTPTLKKEYDIVSLLIGVNNQYQHLSQDQYRNEFALLLNKAIAYAGNKKNRVFVLSIPDYSVTPFASGSNQQLIAKEIDEFNIINRQITEAAGCVYIDITPSVREAVNDPSLICFDGLHPSGKEYYKWAILLSNAIKISLR